MTGILIARELGGIVGHHVPDARRPTPHVLEKGFTLIEVMMGATILTVAIVALLGSFFGQSYLSAHARNLTASINDATRVMEQIRRQNMGCGGTPNAKPPITNAVSVANPESWNNWLDQSAQGKSVDVDRPKALEIVAVTCQEVGDDDGDGIANEYCGWNQTGVSEWHPWYEPTNRALAVDLDGPTFFDPIRVTVAVGWRSPQNLFAGNTSSEFTYVQGLTGKGSTVASGNQLRVGPDQDNDGIIESPAMLTTLITCRQ